jgi:hypothetical protein
VDLASELRSGSSSCRSDAESLGHADGHAGHGERVSSSASQGARGCKRARLLRALPRGSSVRGRHEAPPARYDLNGNSRAENPLPAQSAQFVGAAGVGAKRREPARLRGLHLLVP